MSEEESARLRQQESFPSLIDEALEWLDEMNECRQRYDAVVALNDSYFDSLKEKAAGHFNKFARAYATAYNEALQQATYELNFGDITPARQRQLDRILDNRPPALIEPEAWKEEA